MTGIPTVYEEDAATDLSAASSAAGTTNEDEVDLFPGGLDIPRRSPRNSLHSLYGSAASSRRNSNCSVGSNSSDLSWSSLQQLRLMAAARARSTSLPQNAVYEYSLMLSEAVDPRQYQTSAAEEYSLLRPPENAIPSSSTSLEPPNSLCLSPGGRKGIKHVCV